MSYNTASVVTFSGRCSDESLGWKQSPSDLITPGDPEALFKIEIQLGEGSFGVVYKAMCTGGGFHVAVKALPVFENCIQSAAHELKILRECDHPNIVGYYGTQIAFRTAFVPSDQGHRHVEQGQQPLDRDGAVRRRSVTGQLARRGFRSDATLLVKVL